MIGEEDGMIVSSRLEGEVLWQGRRDTTFTY
jgi:hypothetical protein